MKKAFSWNAASFVSSLAALGLVVGACGDHAGTQPDAGTSGGGDGGALSDGAGSDASQAGASRCTVGADAVTCEHTAITIATRAVTFAVPIGTPPAAGWRAVIYFQGSFIPGNTAFGASPADTFGRYQLTLTIKALLDRGYVVIAPDAANAGNSYWQTNIPPYAQSWAGCADDTLMVSLFASLAKGDFGPIDASRLYAMGISSGGFMTSRMAVSYPGKFRALANDAASYATCGGQMCTVPTPLPSDHPPMLFLHGDTDSIVSISVVQPYVDALKAEGREANLITDANAGHEWLRAGPDAIPSWFDAHP